MDDVKKKMSGGMKLLILFVIFIALVGVLFAVNVYNKKAEAAEEAASSGEEMMSINTDEIESFSYYLDGNLYSFSLGDDGWVYEDDKDAALDQSAVDAMLDSVTSVSTNTIVSDTLDTASDYGLDNPDFMFNVKMNDGTQKTLYIGVQNQMVGVNYAYIKDDDRIFALDTSVKSSFVPVEQLISEDDTEESDDADDNA